jgi:hypothetical protein
MAQDEKLAAELVAPLEETRPSMQGVQRMEEAPRVTGLETGVMTKDSARLAQYLLASTGA